MNLFHMPTYFLATSLLGLVMPAIVWFVLAERRSPAVALWCVGKVLGAMASVLFGLRGHVPEWATFPLANFLMFTGLILRIQSLRRDLALPRRTAWMVAAALLFMLGFEGISLGLGDALLRFQYIHVVFSALPLYLAATALYAGPSFSFSMAWHFKQWFCLASAFAASSSKACALGKLANANKAAATDSAHLNFFII